MGNVDIVCRISDIGGSGKSEIDPFGISGFYGIVTYFRCWEGSIPMGYSPGH